MRRLAALVAVMGVGVLAIGTLATAAPPTHTVSNVDTRFTIPAAPAGPCAFAIEGHFTATFRRTFFFDEAGNLTRVFIAFPTARQTFSANGKSITTVNPAVWHTTFSPDGSATKAVMGLAGHLITGGGPPQAADVGRIVLFYSSETDTDPDLIFQAGKFNDGLFPQLCDVLAP